MSQIDTTIAPTPASNRCISRFTIALLGSALIGMAAGRQLGAELADLCGFGGLLGIACYLSLGVVARGRQQERAALLQRSAESRLCGQKQWYRLWQLCRGPVSLHRYAPVSVAHSSEARVAAVS